MLFRGKFEEQALFRHCLRVSRGSVWPRTCWPFSLRRGARYGMAFSVLQAAKRNGGGVFVAFVVAGGDGRGRPSPSHPLWHAVSEEPPPFRLAERATHQHARARRQRSLQAVSREGRRAKRNPGLSRELPWRESRFFVMGCPCERERFFEIPGPGERARFSDIVCPGERVAFPI